jgi:hypothetical protein
VNSIKWTTQPANQIAAAALAAILALSLPACGRSGGAEHHSAGTQAAGSPASNLGSGGGAFCGAARKFESDQQVIHQAERAAAQGGSGAGSAAVLQAARDSETTLGTMGILAPSSLKPDMQAVIGGWKPFFDSLIHAQGDMTRVGAGAERSMQATVAQPQFQTVNSYEAQTCHFQPSAH